jgi:hypothetical protein
MVVTAEGRGQAADSRQQTHLWPPVVTRKKVPHGEKVASSSSTNVSSSFLRNSPST